MAHSIRRSTYSKPGPLYSLLFIAASVLIVVMTLRATDQPIEPQAGIHATTHEHGMPMLGTLAGG